MTSKADIRTSPPADFVPHGLIRTRELWVLYNAARVRIGDRGKGEEKKPLEWETTALWEYLFQYYLLKGYVTSSQQPPNNVSTKRCDIVTRVFDRSSQLKTLLFTEAKRAKDSRTAATLNSRSRSFMSKKTTDRRNSREEYTTETFWNEARGEFLDIGNDEHAIWILEAFERIRKLYEERTVKLTPIYVPSRPGSQSSGSFRSSPPEIRGTSPPVGSDNLPVPGATSPPRQLALLSGPAEPTSGPVRRGQSSSSNRSDSPGPAPQPANFRQRTPPRR
ncbi:hypothetical protein VTK73DRAFT_5937 [Phialemonium thermophilum]|uniref:Uncharacterized protein n=1 Tax=Phialemonium thermophilum TaxID=223376 RepID=A0ABR3WLV2_9PEZI